MHACMHACMHALDRCIDNWNFGWPTYNIFPTVGSKVKCPNPGMTSPKAFPVFFKKLMAVSSGLIRGEYIQQEGCVGGEVEKRNECSALNKRRVGSSLLLFVEVMSMTLM